jgi:hypothetical protein
LALDVDTTSPLHGLADESSIGAAGHSLGGKLALLETVTDSRIRAVATLDPVDGGGPGGSDPLSERGPRVDARAEGSSSFRWRAAGVRCLFPHPLRAGG